MRGAIAAAAATLVAAFGLTGVMMQEAEAEATSPETSGPDPVLTRPPIRLPILPPVSIPVPSVPLVTVEDTTRDEPETFALVLEVEEPQPEPADIQVSAAPEQSPAPTDTGMGDDVEQWRGLVTAHFGADLADVALCLMGYESGGNPNATNPSSGASGLMQVLPSWADVFGVSRDALYDPDINLSISKALYDDGGWGHWSPWNRGECH